MWNLPGPGLKSVSLALAGGFLTTAPPGKPGKTVFTMIKPNSNCNLNYEDFFSKIFIFL